MALLLPLVGVYIYRASRERDRLTSALESASRELDAASRDRKRLEPEIERVKKFEDVRKRLDDMSAEDPLAWSWFKGSYFCRTDESHMQRLKRAEEKDPAIAAKMRGIIETLQEIDKKGEENNRRIRALQEEAAKGQDSAEKYNQAEMLSQANAKLVQAWLSHMEQFTLLEDEVKAKE